ncbi:MAG: hypothetical protein R3A44_08840 [Caldilineaceae bacterium]
MRPTKWGLAPIGIHEPAGSGAASGTTSSGSAASRACAAARSTGPA